MTGVAMDGVVIGMVDGMIGTIMDGEVTAGDGVMEVNID
jgi:hypothetical protein